MGWSKYLTLDLSVNNTNAIGSPSFNGFGESFKFPAGQYQISYVSGGVISYASSVKNPKYNKYELVPEGLSFGNYNSSFFKEQKRFTWQCMYGVLPGFTSDGFYNPNLISIVKKDDILSFNLNKTTILNFFYTDDCPACAEGTISYNVYRYEETDSYANGITVLTMNIENPFEHETTEFYHHRTPPPPQLNTIEPFTASVWLSHLRNIEVKQVVDIKGFNSLGLKENSSDIINKNPSEYNNMDSYPADTLNNRYSQYSYWKIITEKNNDINELLSEFILKSNLNTRNNGSDGYIPASSVIDKFPQWSYDLLPGTYSIVYLSGATKLTPSTHYYGCASTYISDFVGPFKPSEYIPPLNEQLVNTFCCKYGTLPGTFMDLPENYINSIEYATYFIQNQILEDKLSGVLTFSISEPTTVYMWFNDNDYENNYGEVLYRLYKGYANSKTILKQFMDEKKSSLYTTLSSEKTVLSKKEANAYLKSIFNGITNTTKNDKNDVIISQYYIEKHNEIIKIKFIHNDEELILNENIIAGPYFNINDAKQFIVDYCNINDLDYEELTNTNEEYVIITGEKI